MLLRKKNNREDKPYMNHLVPSCLNKKKVVSPSNPLNLKNHEPPSDFNLILTLLFPKQTKFLHLIS